MRLPLRATVPLVAALTALLASAVTTPLGVLTAQRNAWDDVDAATRQILLQTVDVLRVVPDDDDAIAAVAATAEHVPFPTKLAVVDDEAGVVRARWPKDTSASTWSTFTAAWPTGGAEALRARATTGVANEGATGGANGVATEHDTSSERVLGVVRAMHGTTPAWVVVEVDARPALSVVYRTIAASWLGFIVLVVAGGVVAGRVVRARLRGQMDALLAVARAVAKGDFGARVGDTADDELGTVALALNEMAAELNETRDKTRQSDERYRVIFDEADDAIVLFTDDGVLLDANAAATRLFGRTVDELRVTPFRELVMPDDPFPAHGEALRVRGATGGRGVVHGKGGDVPIDFHGRSVAKVGILALLRDRRPALEAERLRLALVLQDRLAALGTLAAGVGHELNNPLAYVSGNLELLEKILTDLDGSVDVDGTLTSTAASRASIRALLADARSGAARMRHIVAELNLFSRSQRASGGEGLIDVAAEVTAAADIARHGVKERARVDVEVDPSLPRVAGDEGRLAQIVLNLLTNAAQAMPAGRPVADNEVIVRARTAVDGAVVDGASGHGVVIDVVDNGCGIAPAVLPRIFEPFFTTKGRNEGTGLGLSVSRELVLAMGGTIDVDSVVGRGTTFRVRLPGRPAPSSTAAANTATGTTTTGTTTTGTTTTGTTTTGTATGTTAGEVALAGVRVLIVDDDALVARVLRLFLHDATVDVEGSVTAGLHAAARGEHDVILCDLVMPDGGGRAFFEGLSASAPSLRERVIFMTAGVTSDELDAFLRAAGRPVLDKPVDASTLRAQVAVLAAPRARSASSSGPSSAPSGPSSAPRDNA
jgi:PAS domain S-box-containing protein